MIPKRNCILLHVNVPVLSEKMKFTLPNSSIIETVFAPQKYFFLNEYKSQSHFINIPNKNFTNSNVIIKLIGINVFNNKKYVKKTKKDSVFIE